MFPHLCLSFNSSSPKQTHTCLEVELTGQSKGRVLAGLYSVFLEVSFFVLALISADSEVQGLQQFLLSLPSSQFSLGGRGGGKRALLWAVLWLPNTSSSPVLIPPFPDSTPTPKQIRSGEHPRYTFRSQWTTGDHQVHCTHSTSSPLTCCPQNAASLKPTTQPIVCHSGISGSLIFLCILFLLYPSLSKMLQDIFIHCVHFTSLPLEPGMLRHVVQGHIPST